MVGVLYRMVSHIEILQNSNEWFYLHVFYGKLWTLIQHFVTDVATHVVTKRALIERSKLTTILMIIQLKHCSALTYQTLRYSLFLCPIHIIFEFHKYNFQVAFFTHACVNQRGTKPKANQTGVGTGWGSEEVEISLVPHSLGGTPLSGGH